MTQRDNILQELIELQSSLASADSQNVYAVPAGYFDGLVFEVLNRIRALDAKDVSEELNYLSPLLNSISKKMPYDVPAGFFSEQQEAITGLIKHQGEELTPAEELATLSPLLSGLKKEMPYSVPEGYFDALNDSGSVEVRPVAKVVSITKQRWFRYATAAAVVGFIAIGSLVFFNKKETVDPKTQSSEWVKKNMKKVSTDEINKFVQMTDAEAPVVASVGTRNETSEKNDVKELIKDIPDKDIQSFLDETASDNSDNNNDDALMN